MKKLLFASAAVLVLFFLLYVSGALGSVFAAVFPASGWGSAPEYAPTAAQSAPAPPFMTGEGNNATGEIMAAKGLTVASFDISAGESPAIAVLSWSIPDASADDKVSVYAGKTNAGFDGEKIGTYGAAETGCTIDLSTVLEPGVYCLYIRVSAHTGGVTETYETEGEPTVLTVPAGEEGQTTEPAPDAAPDATQEPETQPDANAPGATATEGETTAPAYTPAG